MSNTDRTDLAHQALADAWACTSAAVVSLELATKAPACDRDDAFALADHDLEVALAAIDAAAIAVAAADPLGDRDTSDLYRDLDECRLLIAPVRSELQPAPAAVAEVA